MSARPPPGFAAVALGTPLRERAQARRSGVQSATALVL
jgi:hypothetical protein